jgi:hypothetical protein
MRSVRRDDANLRGRRALIIGAIATVAFSGLGQAGEAPPLDAARFEALRLELDPSRRRWAAIPWRTSVSEARRAALESGKPLAVFVNTGNCLGFV